MSTHESKAGPIRSLLRRLYYEDLPGVGSSGRHAPRLPKFLPTLVTLFVLATLGGWILFAGLARLKNANVSWLHPLAGSAAGRDLFDIARTTVTAAGLFAGVFAVVYAYRKQRVEEAASKRADAEAFAKRYQDGATQLGHDKAPVRLAGVYALARLADDWEDQRQSCVDVLCAYLRMPVLKVTSGEKSVDDLGDLQVRETIWSVIRDHLAADVNGVHWRDQQFDFSRAVIRSLQLENIVFLKPVRFNHARLQGTAELKNVLFTEGASFEDCPIEQYLTLSDVRGKNRPLSFKRALIGKPATLKISTNSQPSTVDDQATQFDGLNIKGKLEVAVVKSKWAQPPIAMDRVHMFGGSIVDIHGTVSLLRETDTKMPQRLYISNWQFDEPCQLGISQDLVDEKTVSWSTSDGPIPDGVDINFHLAWGRSASEPD